MDTEKRLTIPRETANPVAMFFINENPREAALLEVQIDNERYLWEAIVNRNDFRAAEFTLKDGRKHILSPSPREGIDWQLSYIGSDSIPTMHGDFQEDSHYNPREGRNMEELYRDLSRSHSRQTINVTLLLNKTEKGENSVDINNSFFIADMARHYALYNRIPIDPESDFFKAYEVANGTVDRAQYRQILTDTLLHEGVPKVAILQPQSDDLIFRSWSEVNKDRVQSDNYEIVYVSEDLSSFTPDEIYERFNAPGARPGNYYGTSISVGNVIVYQTGEEFIATFVDRFGFHDLPDDFLSAETKQKIEMSLDVRKERDLLNRVTGFVQEQGVELDVARDRERIAAIDRDFEAVFGLADLRMMNAQHIDDRPVEQVISARNSKENVPHGEEGRITLHLRYREPVSINGWTAETDTLTFDSREELDKYINGEAAYDVLDNTVRKRENEILLYADNENGEIVWHTPEWEISSFTAYDGNVYEVIDRWEDQWGNGTISLTVGRDRDEEGDFYLAVVEGKAIYREYEFDEPPLRNSVYERFIDDEAMRGIDRAEARAMGIDLEQEERELMAQDEERKAQQTAQEYVYYSLRRPVSIGTFPRDGMVSFENYDNRTYVESIGTEAWAKLHYNRELTEWELDDYELTGEIPFTPIREFFDSEGKILVGSDIGLNRETGQVDRTRVYEAVWDFEKENRRVVRYPVIDRDGDYSDRTALYSGYDQYVGMSHIQDKELAPYQELIENAAKENERGSDEQWLKEVYTAEVYYAYKNGLTPEQIHYMVEKSVEAETELPVFTSTTDSMRNIRHAFEQGMTPEQIDVSLGQDSFAQQTILQYLHRGGDIERAKALRGADIATAHYIDIEYRQHQLSAEKAAAIVQTVNDVGMHRMIMNGMTGIPNFEMEQDYLTGILVEISRDNAISANAIRQIGIDFIAQTKERDLRTFIESQENGIATYYTHREDVGDKKETPKEQEPTTAAENTGQDEKKTAKDELSEQLMQGVKSVMESDNYKNWLATSSSYFTNNYSMRNAILIFLQKPEASYVKGYEAWKEFGRNVGQGAKGAKIFVPVMAYDKTEGQLFRMVMSNLNGQIKENPTQNAVYRVGISSIEFTMNRNGQVGLRVNGRERTIFPNQQEVKKFISSAILGKVPMYYTVGTVFDVKDTIVPEYLWVKKGYAKDEVVKDKDGKPIKNRKGEIKIFNTPERQSKFRPSLEISVSDPKDPEKMAILYDALKTVSARNGVPVTDVARESDETLSGGADGYFSRQFTPERPKGFIVMPDDLEPTRKVATLLHEMGHSDLHGNLEKLAVQMGEKKISREMREIQAESVAYATARRFGIETDTSSFKYLAVYTQGFDMQDMEKSLDVIYKECKKLTQEIAAELDARGLNLDLTEKESEPMNRETIETLCKQYTAYALEQADTISTQMKELPSLAADNRNSPALLDVVTAQKKCMDRQLKAVDTIHADVKALEGAKTRDEQTAALERLEASKRNIEGEKKEFADLVISFAEISSQSKATLKEEFARDPIATLESMKQDFPKLTSLSSMQLAYIGKSDYVKREYGNLLKNTPNLFVDYVCGRVEALDKAVSKNGTFVEVNFCEQWTDKAIMKGGSIMHPKVADSIVKQAEVQIRGLKAEAEKVGDYFPYNKCDLTVFSKSGKDLTAFHTRIDIGDGGQTSLSDHLAQLCGKESDLVTAFDKATREKGAKEKIVFNEEINAPLENTETVKEENSKTPESFTHEEWENTIAQEKTGMVRETQTAETPEKVKGKDNQEH